MSEAQKGRSISDEHRHKLREAWTRRAPASEATRQKMREHMLGRTMNLSAEARDRIGAANRGKPKSAETLAKMSAAHKGKVNPRRGQPRSEEVRAKISASMKMRKEHASA